MCLACATDLAAAELAERPTETMPIPELLPPTPPAGRHRQRRRLLKLSYFAAGAGVAVVVLAVALVVAQIGELLGGGRGGSPGAGATPPAGGESTAGETPSRAPRAGSCEPQTVTAPGPGAWRMATRRGDIQLTGQGGSTRLLFRVYRAGAADGAASVSVEAMPADEAESRFGIDPPGDGETAVVVSFSPEFRGVGRRFEIGRVGAVDGVIISNEGSGVVAVAGVGGSGCFNLAASGWEEGAAGRSAELVIDIER